MLGEGAGAGLLPADHPLHHLRTNSSQLQSHPPTHLLVLAALVGVPGALGGEWGVGLTMQGGGSGVRFQTAK